MPDLPATPESAFRTWIEIDLAALRHNAGVARQCAGAGGRIMAVVKANGYGLGAVECARALEGDVDAFGVATVPEAIELQDADVRAPIYLLSPVLPDEVQAVITRQLIPAVSTLEEAQAFSENARAGGKDLPLHLVVDTGMGRIGIAENAAVALAQAITRLPGVVIDSVGSHLPSADEDEAFTRGQQQRFWQLLDSLNEIGAPFRFAQLVNSAGALRLDRRQPEMIRAGLMLYGVSPLADRQSLLRPVLTWKTSVALVRTLPAGWGVSYGRTFITRRPTRAATLPVGYADGYQRHLSSRAADVLVHGHRCPLLGRVTMDQIVVDVTDVPGEVAPGDDAVLIGRQQNEEITAREVANKAGTIPYEIFTGIGRRVGRVCLE
jgi:alanine racemase